MNIEINLSTIAEKLNKREALNLIGLIDSNVAEVDFTYKAIKILINSLNVDVTKEELSAELEEMVNEAFSYTNL